MLHLKENIIKMISFKAILINYFLIHLLLDNALKCDSQKSSQIGVQSKQANVNQRYQNLTQLPANKPLDRPSLSLVAHNNSLDVPQEIPADWLMMEADEMASSEAKGSMSFADFNNNKSIKRSGIHKRKSAKSSSNKTFDDELAETGESNEIFDDVDESTIIAGSQKEPDCAAHGRYYCTYKEEYPLKLVTEVTKYYKWPLEKLFRDLHAQIMPKLAQDSTGNLVCDSITRVVRPGWARNTNERWLVVINTENYHQYVTEVVCQYGSNSRCNFIPPCYYSSCQQRYNTQKLLVIDPSNPYRGPFLSEFLFPSCCVCYVPSASDSLQDKYRSSPATIYQRTIQQESTNNLNPPQFRPTGLMDDNPIIEHSMASSGVAGVSSNTLKSAPANQALGPGEIRRVGEQYKSHDSKEATRRLKDELKDFPRLAL